MQNNLSGYQIAQLIYKAISQIISKEEQVILNNWLSNEDNKALYDKITDTNTIKSKLAIYEQIETESVYKKLESKISDNKKNVRLFNILKYAAIIITFLSISYLYQKGHFTTTPEISDPGENITLQLDNGTIKIINEDGTSKVYDAKGNVISHHEKSKMVYNNTSQKDKLEYNTLTIPYGKRFEIVLSDGTNVHLNAGSSLKYPVAFIAGQNRQVFLNGEAYFDVTKDTQHPFIVSANNLNINVLGTQFNVSGYPEDSETDVVLVEGSVNLAIKENTETPILLKPGFKARYNKSDTSISTSPVITSVYTSWIHGDLVFRNLTFNNLLKKLERHYNVEIISSNTELAHEKFNASFRKEPIENILEYFKITYGINYTITHTKILIN